MAAGRNGLGPVCQHGDIPVNEDGKHRRESRTPGSTQGGHKAEPKSFTAHAGNYQCVFLSF